MTTIAASVKHGTMAADSKMIWGGTKYLISKIFRVKGGLLGTAGHVQLTAPFDAAMRDGKTPVRPDLGPDDESSFAGLLLTPNGIILFDDYYNAIPILDEVAAIGSGGDVALSWLKNGADVKTAVERAIECDGNSGPPVVVEKLTGNKKNAGSKTA